MEKLSRVGDKILWTENSLFIRIVIVKNGVQRVFPILLRDFFNSTVVII